MKIKPRILFLSFALLTVLSTVFSALPRGLVLPSVVPESRAAISTCFSDEFSDSSLSPGWTFVDPLNDSNISLAANPGHMRVSTPDGEHDLNPVFNNNAPRLIQTVVGDFDVGTKVTVNPTQVFQSAGLLVWFNDLNFVWIGRSTANRVGMRYLRNGVELQPPEIEGITEITVYFRIVREANTFSTYYSPDGANWIRTGSIEYPDAVPAASVGMYLINNHQDNPIFADFDYFRITCALEVGPVSINVIDDQGNPVSALSLNADGWPAPNPITVAVTVRNITDAPIIRFLSLSLGSPFGSSRFYAWGGPPEGCTVEGISGTEFSFVHYEVVCGFSLEPGEELSFPLGVWIQPSSEGSLDINADLADLFGQPVEAAEAEVAIQLAQIHPVIIVPGLGGSKIFLVEKYYEPLRETLQKMGYENEETLFSFEFDWLNDRHFTVAQELAGELAGMRGEADLVEWVADTGDVAFDILAHSQGVLVSRAYMQLIPDDEFVDVNKLLLVGGANRGGVPAYRAREGLDVGGITTYQFFLDAVLPYIATECGHGQYVERHAGTFVPYATTRQKYDALHDPDCGLLALAELLPAPDPGASDPSYLVDADNVNVAYPFGRLHNPLLEIAPTDVGQDPWFSDDTTYYNLNGERLDRIRERLGGDFRHLHILYNDALETEQTYKVTSNIAVRPLWTNGVVDSEEDIIQGDGDGRITTYSAIAAELWPDYQPHRIFFEENPGSDNPDERPEKHGILPIYPGSQKVIAEILTGLEPPFTTPLTAFNRAIETGEIKALFILGESPIELFVVDPEGRRLGFDPDTREIVNEIPTGVHGSLTDGPVELSIFDAIPGEYTLTVTGTGVGDYALLAQFSDALASVSLFYETGTIEPGERLTFTLTVPNRSVDVPSPPDVSAGPDNEAEEGSPVAFIGDATDINSDDILSLVWDFGDGNTATDTLTPTHLYVDDDTYVVTLTAIDSTGFEISDSANVTVKNVAPTGDAGPAQTVYQNDTVTVSGRWTDPAGSLDNPYRWSWDLDGDGSADSSGTASYGDTIVETTTFALEGSYTLTFDVTDKDGGSGSDSLTIEVLNRPPDCSAASPSIEIIWPADHKFVPVNVLGVTDPEQDEIAITIESIYQDEPVDTYGDGSFTPDGQGVGTDTAELRAERAGANKVPGNGRVYHIGFSAADGQGGSCSGDVLVGVPHNKKATPVDDGALYDSTALMP